MYMYIGSHTTLTIAGPIYIDEREEGREGVIYTGSYYTCSI